MSYKINGRNKPDAGRQGGDFMLIEKREGAIASDNDAQSGNGNPANVMIVPDADRTVKRERRNTIRRIRRAIRKDGMDLHYHDGDYYPVPVRYCLVIDVEQFGRKVGAIQPVGICGGCRGTAWH